MTRALALVAAAAGIASAACGGSDATHTTPPTTPPADGPSWSAAADAAGETPEDASQDAPTVAAVPPVPEVWLRGSTHVHAKPSGDSTTPIPEVIRWYETHGYDFFVLTDHNQVSEIAKGNDTRGRPVLRDPTSGILVFAGTELTHNPRDCNPPGDATRSCRIHVNILGCTARPGTKLDWADRKSRDRVAKYQSALVAGKALGGIAQMNHPNWHYGTTPDLLVELWRRGMQLVEIANAQFPTWNAGDKDHPSLEALWDASLMRGATLWGVASDDAHDYGPRGQYKAGGGWVVVRARREPQAVLDALAAGRFYASNGVVLADALPARGELVVEVARGEPGRYTIEFIENGAVAQRVAGTSARRALPASGYVRAVVTRDDGKKAWVQPARR
ncbi:MAG: PHP domain-containing protein [Deltaproteobacteria bacterium]|nr:PHP domain-containing protein [Deltaproteobacteria bacterium]